MATRSDITMHHCIQGWSGIAQWGGVRKDLTGRALDGRTHDAFPAHEQNLGGRPSLALSVS